MNMNCPPRRVNSKVNVRYRVELSETERLELKEMLGGGKQAVRRLKRAQILLASDAGHSEASIAQALGVGVSTVYRTRRRFVEGNLEGALSEEARAGGVRKLSGKRRHCWWRRPVPRPLRAVPAGR